MSARGETPATGVEDHPECANKNDVARLNENPKIPVAYEEVTLTEEAEEILERERAAATNRPARKLRRMTVGNSATTQK